MARTRRTSTPQVPDIPAPAPPDRRRTRRAMLLAAACVPVLLMASVWAAEQALTGPRVSAEDVIGRGVLAVAAIALVRLALSCAGAARELRAMAAIETRAPRSRTFAQAGHPDGPSTATCSPGRAARLFLGLATATVLSAQAAGATTAPAPPAPSYSVGALAPPATTSHAGDDGEALLGPTFTAARSASTASGAGAATPVVPTSPSSRPAEPSSRPSPPTAPTTADEEAPQPGWTPPTERLTTSVAAVAIGPVRDVHLDVPPTHVVLRGDTLWGIAAHTLPAQASAEQVLHRVRAIVRANPGLADPDLITPGQVLTLPHPTTH